jgi:hypothetical protein
MTGGKFSGAWTGNQRKLLGIADRLDRQVNVQIRPAMSHPEQKDVNKMTPAL